MHRLSAIPVLAIAVIASFSVSACGQKGPLYLPGNPSEIRPEPVEQEQDEGDEDEDEEDDRPPR